MFKTLLTELSAERRLVDIRREFLGVEDVRGFVLFSGFCILRREDITFLRYGTRILAAWERAVAQLPAQEAAEVSLEGMREALRALARRGEITIIRREAADRDTIYIGRSLNLRGDILTLEQLTPEGEADGKVALQLQEVTRLDFGGNYERGLARMSRLYDIERKN
jgi:hypothetical protein